MKFVKASNHRILPIVTLGPLASTGAPNDTARLRHLVVATAGSPKIFSSKHKIFNSVRAKRSLRGITMYKKSPIKYYCNKIFT